MAHLLTERNAGRLAQATGVTIKHIGKSNVDKQDVVVKMSARRTR